MTSWIIREADWFDPRDQAALKGIRQQVFIEEQQVPESMEWDEHDEGCRHFLALQGEQAIACARLLSDGHIGRMAVLPQWRRQGVARALLQSCETRARESGIETIQLSAQVHAIPFYEKAGYRIISDAYLDAGILHRDMIKVLLNAQQGR
jgi:predicted GNAT family N-acyltransferase